MVERRKIRVKMSLTNLMEFKKEDSSEIIQDAVSPYRITTMALDVRNTR